jgi:Domain of unknown function (DUF427)
MAALTRSEHTTYCPYKGDASYYSIPAGGDRSLNAVWTYETPFEAMAQIKDYVAFYPDRVDEISSPAPVALVWRPGAAPHLIGFSHSTGRHDPRQRAPFEPAVFLSSTR